MTSPYLEKRLRRLDEALRDRGLTLSDIGVTRDTRQYRADRFRARRRYRVFGQIGMAVAGLVCVVAIGLVAISMMRYSNEMPADLADEMADQMQDIAPAAGATNGSDQEAVPNPD